jgi:hypothetical protein
VTATRTTLTVIKLPLPFGIGRHRDPPRNRDTT